MTEFYAQPYSIEHTGFYFDSIETIKHGIVRRECGGSLIGTYTRSSSAAMPNIKFLFVLG
jgi:hypothetical protein